VRLVIARTVCNSILEIRTVYTPSIKSALGSQRVLLPTLPAGLAATAPYVLFPSPLAIFARSLTAEEVTQSTIWTVAELNVL
jgi:hypothetical protein